MTRSITRRIATLGLAAVAAATAIGGIASGADGEATTCRTQYTHTNVAPDGWHPQSWNPNVTPDGQYHHTWNPDVATDGWNPHTWSPNVAPDRWYHHTWNPDGDRSGSCVSSSPTTP